MQWLAHGIGRFRRGAEDHQQQQFRGFQPSTAKNIAKANCLSCEQVISICRQFSFEESKLNFAKYAFRHTTDPKNYFKVNDVFSFESSKEELKVFTGGDQSSSARKLHGQDPADCDITETP